LNGNKSAAFFEGGACNIVQKPHNIAVETDAKKTYTKVKSLKRMGRQWET
jgi:hypothetical protein